jgi:SNF2 family DNA or RNA helicase
VILSTLSNKQTLLLPSFSSSCLNEYVHSRVASYTPVNCPSCRKEFNLVQDSIQVDLSLNESEQEAKSKEREAAKEIVREAGRMLEESKGQLSAEMWRALYLAFDLPPHLRNEGHYLFTAIPRDVLTHLRAATGMQLHCRRGDTPMAGSVKGAGRCSKIQALLNDLPSTERSVIFSSNKDCLMHLRTVLREERIGCQAIYTGQSTAELKDAVSNWEMDGEKTSNPPPCPCLLVQAGAAAAGLTLTAASKMFLMEPFLRQEEEHQAYARCHRYSQKHKVNVKVYYTPVSVESRLLEWRKCAKSSSSSSDIKASVCNFENDTEVIVHDMDEVSEDEDDWRSCDDERTIAAEGSNDSANNEDIAQTEFLLGLLDKNSESEN